MHGSTPMLPQVTRKPRFRAAPGLPLFRISVQRLRGANTLRTLTVVTILCLTSTPSLACVFDSECKTGSVCVDSVCSRNLLEDDIPEKRTPSKGKTCGYDGDCDGG